MARTQTAASRCWCAQTNKQCFVCHNHLQTLTVTEILSKGCVYCRINHQRFCSIIHVLSRPLCTRGWLTFFHLPLTLTLIPGSCTEQTPMTIQLNPLLPLLQCILLVNCWECAKWGYFGDSSILHYFQSTESTAQFSRVCWSFQLILG